MTDGIRAYMREARALFPILGRPEKTYLAHMESNIRDCFGERTPAYIEMVIARYGPPEDVVVSYLDAAKPEYLMERMKKARRWRRISLCALVVLLLALVLFFVLMWQEYTGLIEALDSMKGTSTAIG